MGEEDLARQLRNEVETYLTTPRTTARVIYGLIKDAVQDVLGAAAAVRAVAMQLGLTHEELVARYRRAEGTAEGAVAARRELLRPTRHSPIDRSA